jgi:hypothetical protein
MDGALRGESGRLRIPHDDYMTPAENVAALSIGLDRAGITLPPIVLDPCGGRGELASELMRLAPAARVALTDLHPDLGAVSLYAASSPLDATVVADLELALRLSGARAIVSNPPFKSAVYPNIVRAGIELLRRDRIGVMALMQTGSHAIDSAIGYRETAAEPLFACMIACCWRTVLFDPRPGDKNGKRAHAWHVWTRDRRTRLESYPVVAVAKDEALGRAGRRA